ncbi:hypothetical protein C474_15044 [Halogeometricum pallidum JCM 14848]|uniref:Uncharacterized protein n=1 Tax=Halogeometricum pallidum JCM 14848 TaxID=1227487 RepID=M0CYY7_HALPD|nr:hypothetical protein [Halogeometricum pallidum]ELZ28435.1 hypothetical protein C474_15044 [Halogeometricum pallidum JCM 14848]
MPVPPPSVDELDVSDDPVEPRPYADLVAAVMELRSCSKPDAEAWVDDTGLERAERVVLARWRGNDFSPEE